MLEALLSARHIFSKSAAWDQPIKWGVSLSLRGRNQACCTNLHRAFSLSSKLISAIYLTNRGKGKSDIQLFGQARNNVCTKLDSDIASSLLSLCVITKGFSLLISITEHIWIYTLIIISTKATTMPERYSPRVAKKFVADNCGLWIANEQMFEH